MISVTSTGNLKKTTDFLNGLISNKYHGDLHKYGKMGVDALSKATPVDSHLTAQSWGYRITKGKYPGIEWYNTNVVSGVPVAILIQYGHATGTGGYVNGIDYINPAIRSVFDQISNDVWKKVRS